jgi:phage-related protein
MEIKVDEQGDTYRVVYVAKFEEAVYALDAFQKKSPRGKEIPRNIQDRIQDRYRYVKQERPAQRAS